MAVPNLIALIVLSPVIYRETKTFFDKVKEEKKQKKLGNAA